MKKILSIVIGIIIIILGIVILTNDDSSVVLDELELETNTLERLSIQHSFNEGYHAIHGIIAAPTPCHNVDVVSRDVGNDVLIDITLTEGEDFCTQVITNQPFFYQFQASEDAKIMATYNGEEVELNITEIEDGETFELSEFMFKG